MSEFKIFITRVLIILLLVVALNLNAQVFTNISPTLGVSSLNYSSDLFGSGMSSYDLNQDGWDDLSFVLENDTQKIYLNNQGSFELASFSIFSFGENKQLLWVDYDNDYDLDVFLTKKNGVNLLLQNDGNFQFTDVTLNSGLSMDVAANISASFADYDLDGFLDLYVCKYTATGDSTNLTHLNNLYRNNGDGTFTDKTLVSGLDNYLAPTLQSVWMDYNKDGLPDLFVSNDRANWENKLYENNGDATFSNVTALTQTAMTGRDPMSLSIGDYDNDGSQDLFVSDSGTPSQPSGTLFSQSVNLDYIDQAFNLGISIPANQWGSTWLDYNNDGYLDLFVATGDVPISKNFFFRSDSANYFEIDTSIFLGDYFANSFAVASADFNRDGFSDITVVNISPSSNFLWLNSQNTNNYIRVSLEGTVSNSMAIGTLIKVYANNQVYSKYTVCGENYMGQNSQHNIFGLGQATIVDSVYIKYLSGIIDKYYNLAVNQEYQFTEGETKQDVHIELHGNNPFCQRDSVVLTVPNLVSYLWSTGDTTQSIVVFDGGTYSLSAIDSQGISVKSDSITLVRIDNPQLEAELYNPTCYSSNDGQIILSVQNQGQPYISQWSNGQLGDLLTNLSADWYTLTYQDTFACIYKDSFELIAPLPLNVQVNLLPETDMTFASIQLLVNGGTAPYILMLDGNSVGINIDSIAAGNYLLEVLDSLGCLLELHIVVPFEEDSVISALSSEIAEEDICIFYNILLNRIEIKLDNKQYKNLFIKGFDLAGRQLFYIDFSNTEKKGFFNVDLEKIIYQGVLLISLTLDNQRALYRFKKK